MTILVTGGAGFIGSNFMLDWLARHAEPVVNLDKLSYAGNLDNLAGIAGDPRHHFVHGDIGDGALAARLLRTHAVRAVLNFAAESHVDRSIAGPAAFIGTNVSGSFHLLGAVRAYWNGLDEGRRRDFRFLHVSTDEVYGSLEAGAPAFHEQHRYAPNSPYSASKAASDHLVRAWHNTYGLPVLTTNCSNNYGPFQFLEKLIPLMISRALAGEPLPAQLWVPEGFAHGFLVLSESAEVVYKLSDYYAPEHERCITWNDPRLGIAWPLADVPLVSAKDG